MTLFKAQREDGSIRAAETCCFLNDLITFNTKVILENK
jgi:hypothetical protein